MKRKLYVSGMLAIFASVVAVVISVGSATGASNARFTSASRVVVPNVVGMRMDRATRTLHNRRLRVNEECSGLFGCIVKSQWWICHQSPRAGRHVRRYFVVVTYAERRGEC